MIENLSEESAATIAAAEKTGVKYIDLNRASTDYVNAIGQENAAKYDYASGDATHLNPGGEIVFARMVIDLLIEAREDFGGYFDANAALSEKIADGEYATGEE
ncbi:hypothetical protein IMZ48_32590 [Candidatus Bathyarchaeota archaeon]|nr:hypothetical protein [Candidatus Bathyarchaeota archaeon]